MTTINLRPERQRAGKARAERLRQELSVHQRGADERAASTLEQSRRHLASLAAFLEREERLRLLTRDLALRLFDLEENSGFATHEILWAMIRYCAATLAGMQLNEPAGLKVRRLGRKMLTDKIIF